MNFPTMFGTAHSSHRRICAVFSHAIAR